MSHGCCPTISAPYPMRRPSSVPQILGRLHRDPGPDRHAVRLAVAGGFGEPASDGADERGRGFAPRPQPGLQPGDAAASGVVTVRVDRPVPQGAEASPRVGPVVRDDEARRVAMAAVHPRGGGGPPRRAVPCPRPARTACRCRSSGVSPSTSRSASMFAAISNPSAGFFAWGSFSAELTAFLSPSSVDPYSRSVSACMVSWRRSGTSRDASCGVDRRTLDGMMDSDGLAGVRLATRMSLTLP